MKFVLHTDLVTAIPSTDISPILFDTMYLISLYMFIPCDILTTYLLHTCQVYVTQTWAIPHTLLSYSKHVWGPFPPLLYKSLLYM